MNLAAVGWIALGAGIGAPLRFIIDRVVTEKSATSRVPLGLLVVNIFGSALLGIVLGLNNPTLVVVIGSGFCGALTTFSGFAWESNELWRQQRADFLIFITTMVMLCVLAFWLTWTVTSALV